MSIDVTIAGGTGPEVTVGDAGASVSVPTVTGVLSLNGLSGVVSLAVVGGTIAYSGNTITVTITGGGGGASSWTDLTGKPFSSIGSGLSVSGSGVLSATGLSIADTTGLQTVLDAKAPLASPTFTGTVSGITKAMVGLGSVDNTADASKPVSTLQAAADAAVQAYAVQRANHTGTQIAATVSDFAAAAIAAVTWTTITGKPLTFAPEAHTQAWSTITSTPTTLAGYGITDAAPTYSRRFAWSSPYSYSGRAPSGSATSSPVWTIKRSQFSAAGTITATLTATNVAWDSYASATYS